MPLTTHLLRQPTTIIERVALWVMVMLSIPVKSYALELEGDWVQGQMLIGQVTPGSSVSFHKRDVRVDSDGVFVIGLDRDEPASVEVIVTSADGSSERHSFSVQQREYNIQRVEGVPAKTVNPPAEEIARINRESALTRAARRKDLPRRDFLSEFQWPVLGPISGVYGSQRYYNGEPRRPHYGVDVARPTGTLVVAPAGGIVTMAHGNMFFSGGTMILDHGHGISSSFLHLSEILVEEGQEVEKGEPIAKIGATGRVTGPHLDWRMNWFTSKIDPQLLVPPMAEVMRQDQSQ
ncbi:M23 family metallopeptidase [Aurantivibrio plasticivorans]